MAPKSKKITWKTDPKTEAGNHPKMDQKWRPNGAQMEPKRHPKINDFLARFSDPSGNIGGTSREPRVSHFLQPTPQGGAILSKIIVQKQAKRIACGIRHASSRWLGEFSVSPVSSFGILTGPKSRPTGRSTNYRPSRSKPNRNQCDMQPNRRRFDETGASGL